VLDGELAQRAEATRRLREVQKQLMLLGGLVPPSPVVTAAAAAAARGRRNSGNPLSGGGGGARGSSGGGQAEEAALMQEAKALQEAIDGHTRSVKVRVQGGTAVQTDSRLVTKGAERCNAE
jgi:kinesin family protein 4/21/27